MGFIVAVSLQALSLAWNVQPAGCAFLSHSFISEFAHLFVQSCYMSLTNGSDVSTSE